MATNNSTNTSNPITVSQGGTGNASATAYAVLCGGTTTTGSYQSVAALGASGTVLTSNGASALPTFQAASGSGITTLSGNSGSATGSTVTVTTGASNTEGTAVFTGSSATVTLEFTDSSSNVGVGTSALSVGTAVSNCTGIGYQSLSSASLSANSNTCLGYQSGRLVSTAPSNTFVGTQAGAGSVTAISGTGQNTSIGAGSLSKLTTGNTNAGCGYHAGQNITTGANSCFLGALTGTNYTSSESSNIVIGYNVNGTVSESHVLRIGNGTGASTAGNINSCFVSGITGIVVTGVAAQISSGNQLGVASSSKRFKKNIRDMKDASDVLFNLRPVTFTWDNDSAPGLKDAPCGVQFGLIAEEVAHVFPELVVYGDDGKPFSVHYDSLPALLLNEMQKMRLHCISLEEKISELEDYLGV